MKTRITTNCRAIAALVTLAMTLLTGFAWAADEPVPVGPSLVTMTADQALRLSPLHQDMRGILIAEKEQLAVLHEEFAQETDSQRALAIQRRIQQVKVGTEISLLSAQAENARAEGRTEDAKRLEASIELLADPTRGQSAAAAPALLRDPVGTDRQ